MLRRLVLLFTHGTVFVAGFALGIYVLPLLTAPEGPAPAALEAAARSALYSGRFDRNLVGSDFLHWGEGEVGVANDRIAHLGRLAPGPDYKLYLAPEFVDTRDGFLKIKARSRRIGDIKTFDGFLIDVPAGVDVAAYTTVVVWCEAFGMFISAARYR